MPLRSLRRLKNTLNAIRPMAMIKAATAATVSPAIWAGLILGRSSLAAGAAIRVGVEDAVGVEEAGIEFESTKTDRLDDTCVWRVVLVTDVIVAAFDVRVLEAVEAWVAVLDVLLGTTVRAVLVGRTAFS